jgi:DNA-binding transcriptional ArsR family regulator
MPLRDAPVAAAKAELFKALGHPVRVRVLEVLVDGEVAVGELADRLGIELSHLSHLSQQLGVLRRAQVVVARRAGTTVFYSLRDPRMAQLLAVARQLLVSGLKDSQSLLTELEVEAAASTVR